MKKNSNLPDDYLAKIRAVCDGSAEDDQLYEAIANFCRQPNNRRRETFTCLFRKLQHLKGLKRVQYPGADTEIWIKVYEQIGSNFEPQERSKSLRSSLVTWINKKLGMEYADTEWMRKEQKGEPTLSLDYPVDKDDSVNSITLEALQFSEEPEPMEEAIQEEQKQNIAMLFQIVDDPENHLHSCPECTFKAVYEGYIFANPRKTLKQIASEFGVNQSSLRSFWHRACKKIFKELPPELKQTLKESIEDK
ncbi:sigma-70 family RNA polymerase sigma factor [Okeania sp. KiyG1]|uniref:sigma-70 family RNA polymerase sigma factor n=1 Tax=Okeania sp. KiyG1 TaxID=2720165 RepID=UPI0019217BA4|nr:sigma-70 family RNA polymerase sigma factor [Okeania sp. KiyG1]GGA52883.1 hypothetical protein CYANOKiyG1_72840 [Okeania sp. KiyG1]